MTVQSTSCATRSKNASGWVLRLENKAWISDALGYFLAVPDDIVEATAVVLEEGFRSGLDFEEADGEEYSGA